VVLNALYEFFQMTHASQNGPNIKDLESQIHFLNSQASLLSHLPTLESDNAEAACHNFEFLTESIVLVIAFHAFEFLI
jgi:hypothetical protein